MKSIVLLSLLMLSFSSFASAILVNDLAVGDRLEGKDFKTGEECTLEVVKKDRKSITVVYNGNEGDPLKLEYDYGLFSDSYESEIYRKLYKEPRRAVVKAMASVSSNKLSGKTKFEIIQGIYYENYFQLEALVDCRDMRFVP
jgi:hypothetical protein